MKLKSILLRGSTLILLVFMSYGTYQLWCINHKYVQEADIHEQILQYRPMLQASASSVNNVSLATVKDTAANETSADSTTDDSSPPMANQSIVDLQAKYGDALGWLTIPNTQIDYPFVQGNDNEYYLHTDINQNRSGAGTLFIDYRNSDDFSDFNTIIFGHHMRNGSMFGSLQNFNNQDFFDTNTVGTIFLKDKTYEIEFFAFSVISPDDGIIYNPYTETESEQGEFLDHIKSTARYYRDIGISPDDRLVTLSTCNYEFEDARMVVIGRIVAY